MLYDTFSHIRLVYATGLVRGVSCLRTVRPALETLPCKLRDVNRPGLYIVYGAPPRSWK